VNCGVILADRPVSARVAVDDDTAVLVDAVTTWRMRNAPRRSFSHEAGSVVFATSTAGRFVGVAIVLFL